MTEISPKTQALIDRLARMDPANPRHDKAAIERAMTTHLAGLGMPLRPFLWAEGPRVAERVLKRSSGRRVWRAAAGIVFRRAENRNRVIRENLLTLVLSLALLMVLVWTSPPEQQLNREACIVSVLAALCIWLFLVALDVSGAIRAHCWEAAGYVVRDPAYANADFEPWEHRARQAGTLAAAAAARGAVQIEARQSVARTLPWEWFRYAQDAARNAIDGVAGGEMLMAGEHPADERQTRIRLPIVDAFEAGLFVYWVTLHEVICLLQPALSIENGRLHRADGPAVRWPSGEAMYFWHGVRVSDWMIETPERISVRAIRSERNHEISRSMTEIYGRSRYLRDSGARLVHEDGFGRLWEADGARGARLRFVEVENGTQEPDGTRRIYTLEVTNAEAILGWPIETARAAVAATYGLREDEYHPEVRT